MFHYLNAFSQITKKMRNCPDAEALWTARLMVLAPERRVNGYFTSPKSSYLCMHLANWLS